VARRRFAVDGALVPTLDEVRREAEVSVGALYHHFPDKPALAAAVYARLISEDQAGFVTMLRDHDIAEGGIRGGVAYHLRWVTEHRGEARLLLGDPLDSAALRDANRFAESGTGGVPPRLGRCSRCVGVTAALWLGPAQESSWLITGKMPRCHATPSTHSHPLRGWYCAPTILRSRSNEVHVPRNR
jgi:AcrR family transcriptional regulator